MDWIIEPPKLPGMLGRDGLRRKHPHTTRHDSDGSPDLPIMATAGNGSPGGRGPPRTLPEEDGATSPTPGRASKNVMVTRRICPWISPAPARVLARGAPAAAQAPTIHPGAPLSRVPWHRGWDPRPARGEPVRFSAGRGGDDPGGRPPRPLVPARPVLDLDARSWPCPGAPPQGIAAPAPLPITRLEILGTLALPGRRRTRALPPVSPSIRRSTGSSGTTSTCVRSGSRSLRPGPTSSPPACANPILYADSQLVPYGKYGRDRSGGPTQYDLNISHPLDLSHKRQARTVVAERAVSVLEAQYQNAVRLQIGNLYTAYVDALAARETARFAQASVDGLDRVLAVTETLYKQDNLFRPDVLRVKMQKESAEMGVVEARQLVLHAKRALGVLLSMPPQEAEALELRGTIATVAPPITTTDDLIGRALEARPDLIAQRLGVHRAEADVRLARAERLADLYLLYQPYTFQNNAPSGVRSATSWALGVTAPVPIYNRNQGGILRAGLNVTQTQIDSAAIERRIVTEVTQAVARVRRQQCPPETLRGGSAPGRATDARGRPASLHLGRSQRPCLLQHPARLQPGRAPVPQRAGPAPPQHARSEHGGRPANPAVIVGGMRRLRNRSRPRSPRCPLRVASARQGVGLMLYLRKWTEPSANRKFAPPGCRLQ